MKLSGSALRELRHTPSGASSGKQLCTSFQGLGCSCGRMRLKHLYAICRFSDFLDEIWNLYDNEDTAGHAMSTGWKEVDQFYRVRTVSLLCILQHAQAPISSVPLMAMQFLAPHNVRLNPGCTWRAVYCDWRA